MLDFYQLQNEVEKILKQIPKKKSTYKQLRTAITEAASKQYLQNFAKSYNLNTALDRQRLKEVATTFVKSKGVTKTSLKERGWTDSLISKYLGAADAYIKNPVFKSAAPMQIYALTRVEIIESDLEISKLITQSTLKKAARSAIALKISETKRSNLLSWVNKLEISIERVEIKKLVEQAVQHYNCLWQARDYNFDLEKFATIADDPEFLARICTNYLRHECTNYEEDLDKLAGKVGKTQAYQNLKDKINAEINSTYPNLQSQICTWQTCSK